MTVNIICDYCGDPIDGPRIDLESDKHFSRGGRWAEGTFGNFHNTDECFGQIGEAIRAHLTARPGLAAIPVLDEEPPVADSACDDAPDTPPIADRGPQPIVDVALKCYLDGLGIATVADLNARFDAIRDNERQKRRVAGGIDPVDVGDTNTLAGWLAYIKVKTKDDFCRYLREQEKRERRLGDAELERVTEQYASRCREIAQEIGALADVADLDTGTKNALFGAGIMTKAQLVSHYFAGTFERSEHSGVPGVGNARVGAIRSVARGLMSPSESEFQDALDGLLDRIGWQARRALMRGGVRTFEQLEQATDEELLAIKGTSEKTVQALRDLSEARRSEEASVDAGS